MEWNLPSEAVANIQPALLQFLVSLGLAVLVFTLWVRFRKPHFAWWTVAWGLYALRMGVILQFLVTARGVWLFWHQVVTGWTAVAILWAALTFSRGRGPGRWPAVALVTFPVLWSWIAVYRLDAFLLAALPAVGFLALAHLWTAALFERHHRRTASPAARLLAVAFALWGLHHLDYPFLRAQGIWNPWGYYLDVLLQLTAGAGLLLLVQDDLRRAIGALTELATDLQAPAAGASADQVLLDRSLRLPGVLGTALVRGEATGLVASAGVCGTMGARVREKVEGVASRTLHSGKAEVDLLDEDLRAAALPIRGADPDQAVDAALVLVSDARDPFTTLDDAFVAGLGRQLGSALERAGLQQGMARRGEQLQRLAQRLTHQHEEERARLSRDLHDETAQVLAALSLELGSLKESIEGDPAQALSHADGAAALVREGIRGIRSVTERLRPPLLDDLGLVQALRGLVNECSEQFELDIALHAPPTLPVLEPEMEVTLYRALQEGLTNVARHAGGGAVRVDMAVGAGVVTLSVRDWGPGLPDHAERRGHGLVGLKSRVERLHGEVEARAMDPGTELLVTLPLASSTPEPTGAQAGAATSPSAS